MSCRKRFKNKIKLYHAFIKIYKIYKISNILQQKFEYLSIYRYFSNLRCDTFLVKPFICSKSIMLQLNLNQHKMSGHF